MTAISITFDGVYVHLQKSNDNAPLSAPYRVAAPDSPTPVSYRSEDLGAITPSVTISGQTLTGPLVLTISGSSPGTTPLPPASSVPHLSDLALDFRPVTEITYADFPARSGIFLNLDNVPGSWPMAGGQKLLTFVSDDLEEITVAIQTAPGEPPVQLPLTSTAITFTNIPTPAVTPNNPETLLGFLALASSIPPDAVPPAGTRNEGGVDPSQPGCSNSQWP